MKETAALVMLSGGLDSATCLYWAKKRFVNVSAITFNYYDRIENEKKATFELARSANIDTPLEIDIPFIKESSDFLDLNYDDPKLDKRLASYIPMRNLIFYSIAAHFAEFHGIKYIIGGHNMHDSYFFKDATVNYIQKVNSLLSEGCLLYNDSCLVLLPLAELDRKSIIKLAIDLKVPIESTWSCHNKQINHCGECYACVQRAEAFNKLGISDPVFL